MTFEQFVFVFALLVALVTAIVQLVSILAGIKLRQENAQLQNKLDLERDRQTHDWHREDLEAQRQSLQEERVANREGVVADRNQARQWTNTDKLVEQRKAFLFAHKAAIDEYISLYYIYHSQKVAKKLGLSFNAEAYNDAKNKLMLQTVETIHHIEVFKDTELLKNFHEFTDLSTQARLSQDSDDVEGKKSSELNVAARKKAVNMTLIMERILTNITDPQDHK